MDLLNRSEKIFKVCAYLLVIAFAAVTLYPIVYAFSVSISGRVAYESGSIVLLPKDVTLQAYDMVLHSKVSGLPMQTPCSIRWLARRGVCLSL